MSVSITRVRAASRAFLAAVLAAIGLPLALVATASPAAAAALPPVSVTVELSVPEIEANGLATGYAYASIKDSAGLPFTDELSGEVLASTSGDVTFSPSSRKLELVKDGTNRWRIRYRASKTAGQETITITARNAATSPGGEARGSAVLTEKPGPVTSITLGLTPTHIPADGLSTSNAVVTLADQYGNKVPGQSVVLGVSGDTAPGPVTDNGDGTYSSKITSSTTPGQEVVTATGGGKTANATLTEFGAPANITLALNPSTLVANGTSTSQATATVTDAAGNGVAGRAVSIKNTTDGANTEVTPITDVGNGTYTAVITASTVAGTKTYTASVPDTALVTSANLTQTPGPVHEIKFALAPTSIVANGVMTSTATVTLEDVNDNAITNEVVTITKATGNDVTIGEVTNNNGTYTGIITSSTTVGTNTITAAAGGKSVSATLTETPDVPSSVALSLTPSSVIANGANTVVAKAAVKDAYGNAVKDATVSFTKAVDDDVKISPTVTNNGDGTYQVTVTASTTKGVNTITATAGDGGPSGSATLTETAGPATTVALAFDPLTELTANGADTTTAIATVTDQFNNKITNENVTITKASGNDVTVGAVSFDAATETYRALITASTTTGTNTITAKANNANKSVSAGLAEKAGPVATVAVVVDPASLPANGTSTSTATVTIKDAFNNPITNESVEVSSTGGPTLVATNNNNGTYTATITATTTPGDRTVTAVAVNSAKSGTATLNQFGAIDSLTVTATPSIVPADGTTTGTLKATAKDAGGNPITNATVGFGTNGNIFIGSVTNNKDGTYTAPFRASTTPGTETITATAGKTATTQIIEYGSATSVSVALAPSTVTADGVSTSTATATVKDANNNPVLNENVTFVTNGDAVPGPVTNNNNGTYTSTITASSTAGAETITATATKARRSGTATLTEVAGPAAAVTLALNPTTVPADGVSKSTATVTVKDAKGNLVKNETVALATSGDAVPDNAGATTNNNDGTYTGSITASTTAGVETITATALGTGAFATAGLTEKAGGPASVTLSLSPSTVQADGVSTSTATASVRDGSGNLVPDSSVTISTDGDAVVGSVTDNGDGTHTAVITASTTAGTETITAAAADVDTPATATLTESAGPVSSIVVALAPSSIVANGSATSEATATVKDEFGNVATGDVVSFTKDGVAIGNGTNNGDGTYTVTITSSKVAGPKQIVATAASSGQSASAVLTETAGPLSSLTLSLDPSTVVANGTATSAATATAADANGNPIKDEVVTLATSGDAVVGSVTNNNDGAYKATVTASKTAGTETITATATKAGSTVTAALTETAGPVASVAVALSPASIVADGVSTSVATATVKDADSNVVKDAVVTMATSGDAVVGEVANKGDGTYTSTITSSTTAGVETITAAVAATRRSGSASLTETAGPATSVAVSLSPSSIVADGVAKSVATATVKDANGNLVPDETVTFASSGDAKPGAVSNKGNGTYTSTITSSKTAGKETITATATKANKKGTATLTETARSQGYWLTAADGGIFTYGSAQFHGSIGGTPLNQPVVGMTATLDKGGYWQVASDGGIFSYGNANFHGSMGGQPLNAPVVGMAATTNGAGYWLVASDGGIFSFNAPFLGSMGGQPLNAPINGMMADPDGDGYWFVASDGGIFSYNAPFYGSMGGQPLSAPIVAMTPAPDGKGYWMVGSDGAVYPFGSAGNFGSMAGKGVGDVVGVAAMSTGKGYWLTGKDGSVYAFGDAVLFGSPRASGLQLVSPISAIAGF